MTVIKEAPKSLIHAKMEQAGLAAAVGFADEVGALSLEKKIRVSSQGRVPLRVLCECSQRKVVKIDSWNN